MPNVPISHRASVDLLHRKPPIRRHPGDLRLAGRIHAEGALGVRAKRAVSADIEVEGVVDESIQADPPDLTGGAAFDEGGGGGPGGEAGSGKREAPRRRGVPRILHRRIVIHVDAEDRVLSADGSSVGVTQFRVVPGPCLADTVIGRLAEDADLVDERPDVLAEDAFAKGAEQPPSVEDARLGHGIVVVVAKSRRRPALLGFLRVGKGRLEHHSQGQKVERRVRGRGVAAQLELAPKLVEHRKLGVAGGALHVQLAGETGQRLAGRRGSH
jgi:hypothetical protein